jgi:outer membrane protein assembly factor BamB
VVITLLSLATATVMVRAGLLEPVVGAVVDQAVRNIITLILCFSGLVSLVLWFVRESGHATAVKRGVVGAILAAVAIGAAVLRIERVSGDLVPEFAFRWSPSRDRRLPRAATPRPPGNDAADAAAAADSWRATPRDSWRFLGPDGAASIAFPELDPDWEGRPPRQVWRRPIGAGWSGFSTAATMP